MRPCPRWDSSKPEVAESAPWMVDILMGMGEHARLLALPRDQRDCIAGTLYFLCMKVWALRLKDEKEKGDGYDAAMTQRVLATLAAAAHHTHSACQKYKVQPEAKVIDDAVTRAYGHHSFLQ